MHLSIFTPRDCLLERAGPTVSTGHSISIAERGWKGSTFFLHGDWGLIHPGDHHGALDSVDNLPKMPQCGFFPVLYESHSGYLLARFNVVASSGVQAGWFLVLFYFGLVLLEQELL